VEAGTSDNELVEQAKNGDRAALEKLVLRHQAWIYNIAVRMVFHPQDAEEVTQEVLVKVITKLSTFKGESKFRTWLYRIAANHVLNMKRRSAETKATTFADFGAAISRTPDLDLPDPKSIPVELPVLVEEAKNGCTMGMLLCLDRKQRLIFTLGEILGATDAVAGEVLEMTAENNKATVAWGGHAFGQQHLIFQAEATGGMSRKVLHGLLQRPGLRRRDWVYGVN